MCIRRDFAATCVAADAYSRSSCGLLGMDTVNIFSSVN